MPQVGSPRSAEDDGAGAIQGLRAVESEPAVVAGIAPKVGRAVERLPSAMLRTPTELFVPVAHFREVAIQRHPVQRPGLLVSTDSVRFVTGSHP